MPSHDVKSSDMNDLSVLPETWRTLEKECDEAHPVKMHKYRPVPPADSHFLHPRNSDQATIFKNATIGIAGSYVVLVEGVVAHAGKGKTMKTA